VSPEDVVKKFVAGFNRHDGSVMKLFTKDVLWQDPGGLEPEGGWERMQRGVLSAFEVFPDIRMEVSHLMTKDDWVAYEGYLEGTFKGGKWFVGGKVRSFPSTNKRVKLSTAWFFRVNKDGLISYWSWYQDNFQLLAQAGLGPDQIGLSPGA
jgi:predicted ester cyclase